MNARQRVREKLSELKRKGDRDVRRGQSAARRRARQSVETAKQKAKQDVDAAERTVRQTSARDVAAKAAAIAAAAGGESQVPDRSMMERAREAGEARAPIDAELDPGGDPRAIEAFAQAGDDSAEPLATGDLGVGGGLVGDDMTGFFGSGGDGASDADDGPGFFGQRGEEEADDADDLEFDDSFGLTGGERRE